MPRNRNSPQWELKHFTCNGTIIELYDDELRYEADLVSWFGETIFAESEGLPDPLLYFS